MIPSANSAIRDSPPPLNVFSRLRIPPPPKFFWTASTALVSMPGTGMCEPKRYSASSAAVKASFLRISPTVKALRIVDSIGRLRLLDQRAGPAGRLDGLARGGAEGVGVDGERLGDLALGQDLDRDAPALAQAVL